MRKSLKISNSRPILYLQSIGFAGLLLYACPAIAEEKPELPALPAAAQTVVAPHHSATATLPAAPATAVPDTAPLLELPSHPVASPAQTTSPVPPSSVPINSTPSSTPVLVPVFPPATNPLPVISKTLPSETESPAQLKNSFYKPNIISSSIQPEQKFLAEPLTVENDFSLMFSREDMNKLIIPSLALYDNAAGNVTTSINKTSQQDDLTGLLESLQTQTQIKEIDKPLPNIYLGSIIYYTPTDWSVWINARKLPSRLNKPDNEYFISALDTTHITLVWKPSKLGEMHKIWTKITGSQQKPPQNVKLDDSRGTVTITLRPNQTFLPLRMTVEEGLIKQKIPDTVATVAPNMDKAPASAEEKKTDAPVPPPVNISKKRMLGKH